MLGYYSNFTRVGLFVVVLLFSISLERVIIHLKMKLDKENSEDIMKKMKFKMSEISKVLERSEDRNVDLNRQIYILEKQKALLFKSFNKSKK